MEPSSLVSRTFTITKLLIAINVAVFFYLEWIGDTNSGAFMLEHGALAAEYVILGGQVYRLLTAVFLHFGIAHLFNNMLLLLFMGELLEKRLGKFRFALFYLLCGIAGNVLTLYFETNTGSYSVSAGASGAVFGVLGGLVFLLIARRGTYGYLNVRSMLFFIAYSLYSGHVSGGVNNVAHIGGLICGFLLMPLLCVVDFRKRNAYT